MKKFIKSRDPKTLLNLYITGSLGVLLACLCGASFIFSATFLKKEEQRANLFGAQLVHFFEFKYRLMAEDMWTKNYEAIAMHVDQIAQQLGNVSYDLVLTDKLGECLYRRVGEQQAESCAVPSRLQEQISKFKPEAKPQSTLAFDENSRQFVYMTPFYVGPKLLGYVHASVSDPYDFYKGSLALLAIKMFLPAILAVLLIWLAWLIVSRQFILKPYLASLLDTERERALGKLVAQIFHDIHSPLTTLMSVVRNASSLPVEQGRLLKSSAARINSLIDYLMSRYKNPGTETDTADFTLISSVVNSIVAEKIAILGDDRRIEIRQDICSDSLPLGVSISSNDLSRILSNLINNSIDALSSKEIGLVTIQVRRIDDLAVISVRDNGKGICSDNLAKVRTIGGSFEKENGHGIGLQFTKETLIHAGGKFHIDSTQGVGTTVTLELPLAVTPAWCATELEINSNETIVVLDDEECVHLLWKERLEGRKVVFLKSADEFDIAKYPVDSCRYFFDYEISGSLKTGLDLIKANNLGSKAVLVTSYFNDAKIQQAISTCGSKMLPKFMVPQVKIRELTIKTSPFEDDFQIVLVDDDQDVRDAWEMDAAAQGKKLLAVSNEVELKKYNVNPTTPVFIDKNLANGISGIDVASRLHGAGFTNLRLATGEFGMMQSKPTFIQAIVSKEFPG